MVKEKSTVHSALLEQETLRNDETKQEVEVENMKAECENLKVNIDELQNEIKKLTARLTQATVTAQNEERELKGSEEQKKIKGRAYELFQDGPENIKKLESAIEASTNKLINLANQWEKHRVPLIMKYRQEREKYSTKAVSMPNQREDSFFFKRIIITYFCIFLYAILSHRMQARRNWTR